jgi:hypothetical protein
MKRIITFLILGLLSYQSEAQTAGKQIMAIKKEYAKNLHKKSSKKQLSPVYTPNKMAKVPAKQTNYEWNNSDWEFVYNADITYHADGRKNEELLKDLANRDFSRVKYNYDGEKRISEVLSEMKSNSGWVPYLSTVFQYNNEGDLILNEDRLWMNNAWAVMNGTKFDISYDPINNTKTTVEYYFNGSGYDTSNKYIVYYTNNIVIADETQQYVGNQTFVPIEKYEYLYENAVDTGMLKYVWDGTTWNENLLYCNYVWSSPSKEFLTNNNVYVRIGSDWFMHERESFSLDANGSLSYLLEDYAGGLWLGNMRIQSLNDTYKNRVAYIYDLYLGGTWQQLFRIEEEYTYDSEGNILMHIYKETDSNGDLHPISKDVFSDYFLLTGLNNIKHKALITYPNPAKNTIYLPNNLIGKEFRVKNLLGAELFKGKVSDESFIDISTLTNGTYVLSIEDYFSKIIVEK